MKYFVQLIFLLLTLNLQSQTIFDEDLEWFFTSTLIDPIIDDLIVEKYSVKIGDDKIIDNFQYKQLLFKKNEAEGYLPSNKYMRQMNDTILVYHGDEDVLTIEYIENTHIGQIIKIIQSFPSCNGKVIEIDSIESFGEFYKTTYMDWLNRLWIEGIGTDVSMFTPYTCSNQGHIVVLNCVFKNGIRIYQRDENIDCSNHLTANEEISGLNDIKVFPNPADDMLQFNKPISKISIYDSMGKLLLDKTINSDYIAIDHLSTGMYFLKLRDKNNNTHLEKIIKI